MGYDAVYKVFRKGALSFKSSVKMDVAYLSETSIFTDKTTWHHSPEVCILKAHSC
jgi:hypothetical protein